MKETLTIERVGEFKIRAFGPNHCGTLKEMTIRYKMVCVCSHKLDVRGFLFDQLKVDEFFQTRLNTQLSCEKLTVASLRGILAAIQAENPSCDIQEASLTLSPQPFAASMTYRLQKTTKRRVRK
jgi:hypothetical protein